MGWFHIERDLEGTARLYKPVWEYNPRPRDPLAENEKFEQEATDKAEATPTPRTVKKGQGKASGG